MRIRMRENSGIARAQNIGIARALELGADVLVLFDQDSEPGGSFLDRMLVHVTPGVTGVWAPVCRDKATNEELPSFRLNGLTDGEQGLFCGPELRLTQWIWSSLPVLVVTAATFSVAGSMDEDFFIDFRRFRMVPALSRHGVPICVVPDAVLPHSIGERTVNMGIMRGPAHGVARSYYKIRNCFLLFRKPDVPLLYAASMTISGVVRYRADAAVPEGQGRVLEDLLQGNGSWARRRRRAGIRRWQGGAAVRGGSGSEQGAAGQPYQCLHGDLQRCGVSR